jgi:hypothetical protein
MFYDAQGTRGQFYLELEITIHQGKHSCYKIKKIYSTEIIRNYHNVDRKN